MNPAELFASVNKVMLAAFAITVVILIYEFYHFKKESKKKTKVAIPPFNPNQKVEIPPPQIVKTVPPPVVKHNGQKLGIRGTTIFLSLLTLAMTVFIIVISLQLTSEEQPRQVIQSRAAEEPTSIPTLEPTEAVIAQNPTVQPTQEPTAEPTQEPTMTSTNPPAGGTTPTEQVSTPTLPVTGVTQYSLILFAVSTVIIFLSFLY